MEQIRPWGPGLTWAEGVWGRLRDEGTDSLPGVSSSTLGLQWAPRITAVPRAIHNIWSLSTLTAVTAVTGTERDNNRTHSDPNAHKRSGSEHRCALEHLGQYPDTRR